MTDNTTTRVQYERSRIRTSGTPRQANTALAIALVVALAIAPIPFGSVRPVYWGVWAVFLGLVGATYFGVLALKRYRFRLDPATLWPAAMFAILTCLYLVAQLLPTGPWTLPGLATAMPTVPQISIVPDMTLLMLMRQLSYALFMVLMMQTAINDNRRGWVLRALCIIVVAYGAYAIVSVQSGDTILGLPKWAYLGSATGPFVNRNSFATFLGLGAIIALALGCALIVRRSERHAHDRPKNLPSGLMVYGLAYLFLLSVVVATQSRMGLIATLAGSATTIAIMLANIGRIRFAILALPLLLGLTVVALFLSGDGLLERIGGADQSTSNRIVLYRQVLDLIALRPLTGFGGGSFELAFPLVHQAPLSPDFGWARAHSTYLTLWAELGLVFGSMPILAILYLGWRMALGIARRRGSWTAPAIGLGAIVVGGLHSLVDFSLEIPAVTLLFLALVAIGVATTTPSTNRAEV